MPARRGAHRGGAAVGSTAVGTVRTVRTTVIARIATLVATGVAAVAAVISAIAAIVTFIHQVNKCRNFDAVGGFSQTGIINGQTQRYITRRTNLGIARAILHSLFERNRIKEAACEIIRALT